MQNIDFWTRITSLFRSQISPVVLCMQNSSKRRCFQSKNHRWGLEPIETSKSDAGHAVVQAQNHRIISLYGSQTSPVVLCMQYSVISTRITCLFGSQPLSIFFACKTATIGAELQISMCAGPHLSFCARKTAWSAPELLVSMGSSPHLWFCAFKTATFRPEYKSLWVPALICCFVHSKHRL